MLLMRIERWEARRDGPLSEAALLHKIEALGYSPVPATYPSGATAASQVEPGPGIKAVVRGLVKVTIDGEAAILAAGDIVFVPRGAVLRVEAVGAAAQCLEASSRRDPA